MLALRFTFPAGRYHANPWDRHVNEGEVAWPPDPWRLLRALLATWHHKIKFQAQFEESTLIALIESLAQSLPEYVLPAASHSHTRHYLPRWKRGDTSLVFDAFAAIKRDDPMYMIWPQLDMPKEQKLLLDGLLEVMTYFGRAESWVEATSVTEAPAANCIPGDMNIDVETGELRGEVVSLFAAATSAEYQQRRNQFMADKKQAKKLEKTLPENLMDALCIDTADLKKQGWSQPPASRKVSYLRPVDALRPVRVARKPETDRVTTACYLLVGNPLPRIEDAVRIGELMRQAVMSEARKQLGEDNIPTAFSGHNLPADNRHAHAFFLPLDTRNDGRINRILVHVPASLGPLERSVLASLSHIWNRGGSRWQVILESIGDKNIPGSFSDASTSWISLTPYLHPWHLKKNFVIEDQIKRECLMRGLPEPVAFERLESIQVKGRALKPLRFHRFRNKRGLTQPDTHGSFWRLIFAKRIEGPLALGFGCHYGLGMFRPD